MIVNSVNSGTDNEYNTSHLKLSGSPLEVATGDYIAGISVYSTSPAEHGGYPATRINLGTGGSERDGNVGRLVLRNDQYENAGILEWVRTFDNDSLMDDFVRINESVVPPGLKKIEARQLSKGDKLAISLSNAPASLNELRYSYVTDMKYKEVINVGVIVSEGLAMLALGLWGHPEQLIDPATPVYIIVES